MSLEFSSVNQWREHIKTDDYSKTWPKHPHSFKLYKGDWIGWTDFLGYTLGKKYEKTEIH